MNTIEIESRPGRIDPLYSPSTGEISSGIDQALEAISQVGQSFQSVEQGRAVVAMSDERESAWDAGKTFAKSAILALKKTRQELEGDYEDMLQHQQEAEPEKAEVYRRLLFTLSRRIGYCDSKIAYFMDSIEELDAYSLLESAARQQHATKLLPEMRLEQNYFRAHEQISNTLKLAELALLTSQEAMKTLKSQYKLVTQCARSIQANSPEVLFYNRLRNYLVKQSRSFDENIQLFQTAIEQLKQPTPYRLKPLKEHIKNLDLQSILEARRVLVREIKATNNALDAMEYRPEVLSSWEAEYASAAPTEADADDSLIQPQLAHLPAEAAVPKSCLLKEEDKGKGKRVKFNEEGKCAPPEDRK